MDFEKSANSRNSSSVKPRSKYSQKDSFQRDNARLHLHLFAGLACGVLTLHFATGKRISQKLLRNCVKFLSIIHDVLKIAPMEYLKQSSDEVDIRGPESKYDSRKINSYPSKVRGEGRFSPQYTYLDNTCASSSILRQIIR